MRQQTHLLRNVKLYIPQHKFRGETLLSNIADVQRVAFPVSLTGDKPGKHADLKKSFPRFLESVLLRVISTCSALGGAGGSATGGFSGRVDEGDGQEPSS